MSERSKQHPPQISTQTIVRSIIDGKPLFTPPNISISWNEGFKPSVKLASRKIGSDGYTSGGDFSTFSSSSEYVSPDGEVEFRIFFWSAMQAALLDPSKEYHIYRTDKKGINTENQNNAPFRGDVKKIIQIDGVQIPTEMNAQRRRPEYFSYGKHVEVSKQIVGVLENHKLDIHKYTQREFSYVITLISALLFAQSLQPTKITHSQIRKAIRDEKRKRKQANRQVRKKGNNSPTS